MLSIDKFKTFKTFLQTYCIVNAVLLFAFSFFLFPTTDTYYYFEWSRHLQLSYLDGPPMIAYLLWLSTHIFGNNFFALELISILSIYGSTVLIYKITRGFQEKVTALCAAALWLVFPMATTRFIAVSMTLDGLEVFFSLLIVYYAFLWIRSKRIRYIYYLGIAAGFGILAKYNVIILLAALMLYFLVNKELRKIYLIPHFYISMLISIALCSPILLWNYWHGWVSFHYQLNLHKWVGASGAINSATKYGIKGIWFYLSSCIFGVLNIFLLILGYMKFKKYTLENNLYNKNLIFIMVFILLFWLSQAYSSHIGLNYMTTISSLIVIVVSQYLINNKYYRFTAVILILFSLITIIMLINKTYPNKKEIANYNKYIEYVGSGTIHCPQCFLFAPFKQ